MTRQVRGTCWGQKGLVRDSNCLVPDVGRANWTGLSDSILTFNITLDWTWHWALLIYSRCSPGWLHIQILFQNIRKVKEEMPRRGFHAQNVKNHFRRPKHYVVTSKYTRDSSAFIVESAVEASMRSPIIIITWINMKGKCFPVITVPWDIPLRVACSNTLKLFMASRGLSSTYFSLDLWLFFFLLWFLEMFYMSD